MTIEWRGQSDSLEIRLPSRDWMLLLNPPPLAPGEGSMICHWVASSWQRMPGGKSREIPLPKIFLEPQSDHIVFYPGSFNPWHDGHRACVELTPVRPLVVVPDANPWKDSERLKDGCPWREILTLTKYLPHDIVIYPGFWAVAKSNPTVDWLPLTKWKSRSLTMGSDSLINLPKWKDVGRLLDHLEEIFIVPRNADKNRFEASLSIIRKLKPNLKLSTLPNHAYEALSSTNLRGL